MQYTINWIPYPLPHTPGSVDPATNQSIPDHNTQAPSSLGTDLADAWTCFSGTNPSGSGVTSCDSEPAWLWFVVYLAFNLFFNLLLLWLTKYLSATWATIGTVLCGNLYGVFNQWEVIGGKGYEIMTAEQWLALIYSSMAMWVYNIADERNADGKSIYGVDAAAARGALDAGDGEKEGLLDDGLITDEYSDILREGPSPVQSRKVTYRIASRNEQLRAAFTRPELRMAYVDAFFPSLALQETDKTPGDTVHFARWARHPDPARAALGHVVHTEPLYKAVAEMLLEAMHRPPCSIPR
eukprot:gene6717-21914_t